MSQAATSPITRRTILAGAAIAALPIPASAEAHGPDAKLLRLGGELSVAWAEERGLEAKFGYDESPEVTRAFEAAIARIASIVRQIERYSATTIAGLRVKALALSWCHSGDMTVEDMFEERKTTDIRLVRSILRDLIG